MRGFGSFKGSVLCLGSIVRRPVHFGIVVSVYIRETLSVLEVGKGKKSSS